MKRPVFSAFTLSLGIVLSFATGCSPKPPTATGPSPREKELMATVTELREKLAAAEKEIELAKAEALKASAPPIVDENAAAANPAENPAPAAEPEPKIVDTHYIVVKKTFVPGKLISKRTPAQPNATERQPADCRIVFKGVPSGKEYPALEVQEIAYNRFREGVAYSPQDLNRAKKPVAAAASDATRAAPLSPGVRLLSPEEARSIFGD